MKKHYRLYHIVINHDIHVFKFYQLTFRILFLNKVVYHIWISYLLGFLWGKLYSQFDFYTSISLIENYVVVIEMKYSDWQAGKLLPSCCAVILCSIRIMFLVFWTAHWHSVQHLLPSSFEGLYLHIGIDHSLMYASFMSHIWVLNVLWNVLCQPNMAHHITDFIKLMNALISFVLF